MNKAKQYHKQTVEMQQQKKDEWVRRLRNNWDLEDALFMIGVVILVAALYWINRLQWTTADSALFSMVFVLIGAIERRNYKRLNALIKLLQSEGSLESVDTL